MKEGDRVVALEGTNWFDKGEEGTVVVMDGAAALVQWKNGGGQWWALRENLQLLCTCPSGDGSLRWPCSAHPAEVAE